MICPVVVIKVNGVLFKAFLDLEARSSYTSSVLLQEWNLLTTTIIETKPTEMMLHATTKKVEVFEVQIQDVGSNFKDCTTSASMNRSIRNTNC